MIKAILRGVLNILVGALALGILFGIAYSVTHFVIVQTIAKIGLITIGVIGGLVLLGSLGHDLINVFPRKNKCQK